MIATSGFLAALECTESSMQIVFIRKKDFSRQNPASLLVNEVA